MQLYLQPWPDIVEHELMQAKKAGLQLDYAKFKEHLVSLEKVGHLFDYALKARCFVIAQNLKKDFDHVMVLHSKEGWGKSTLAIQIACSINPNWNLSFMCFSMDEIVNAFKIAQPGDCIIIDEGSINFFSRESMTKGNKILTKLFMIGRQKNLCIIICIPNFHLLDTYIRDHRTDTLIALKQRGRYIAYTGRAIKRVSMLGHKFKEVVGIKCANGTFWEGYNRKEFPYTINQQEYLLKKQKHLASFITDLENEDNIETLFVPARETAELLHNKPITIQRRIQKGEIPGEMIQKHWYVRKEFHEQLKNTLLGKENAKEM